MNRASLDQLPDDHRRAPVRFVGITDDDVSYSVEVRSSRRMVGSSGLVKTKISAMSRGRPMTERDLYQQTTEIMLLIEGRQRIDIKIEANGSYVSGRYNSRSLRELVGKLLEANTPRPLPTPRL